MQNVDTTVDLESATASTANSIKPNKSPPPSRLTLTIAERNNTIAEQFRNSLQTLLHAGKDFDVEVARFRV